MMSSAGVSMINWADLVILAIIGLSVLISLFRGFVREVLSLASWIVAFWIAFTFFHAVSDALLINYIKSPTLRFAAAFGGLFLIVLIACSIVNFLISSLITKTGLSGTDRLLGAVFGLARGLLLVSALLLAARLTPMPQEAWWKGSFFIPDFNPVEKWLQGFLPKSLEERFQLSKDILPAANSQASG